MKKRLLTGLTLSILAILIAGCTASPNSNQPTRILNVNGTGTVKLEPDIARVNIGVRSQSPDIQEAFNDNNFKSTTIIETLTGMGVDQNDIQTQNFNVFQQEDQPRPQAEGSSEGQPQKSFVVENTVAVTVRDLDSLGEILSKVIEDGANTIYGISFDIADREAALAEAQTLAIQDAREKAAAIAEEAGINLGEIHSIEINQDYGFPREAPAAEEMAAGIGSVPISEGTMSIDATVYLVYKIN